MKRRGLDPGAALFYVLHDSMRADMLRIRPTRELAPRMTWEGVTEASKQKYQAMAVAIKALERGNDGRV